MFTYFSFRLLPSPDRGRPPGLCEDLPCSADPLNTGMGFLQQSSENLNMYRYSTVVVVDMSLVRSSDYVSCRQHPQLSRRSQHHRHLVSFHYFILVVDVVIVHSSRTTSQMMTHFSRQPYETYTHSQTNTLTCIVTKDINFLM